MRYSMQNRVSGARYRISRISLGTLALCFAALALMMPVGAQDATPVPSPTPLGEPNCAGIAPLDAQASYFLGLGDVYFDSGLYPRAVEAYSCALMRDGSYAQAYVRRGFARAALLDEEAAAQDYETALALDGNLVSAYNNYGVLYTNQGNFGLALTQFNLAAALAPQNPSILVNRAVIHAIEGRYDQAVQDLNQAITLDPNFAPAYAALGATYSAMSEAQYAKFHEVQDNAVLPGLTPQRILEALIQRRTTGDYGVWLSFLIPAD
jgi:tetratricopeptide (TPR) repeat protein